MKATRLRLLGGAVLALVLVAGGMSGAAIDRAVSARRPAVHESRERDECARFRPERRRGPYDALGLTAEQQQKVDVVLEENRQRMDEFWKQYRPQMDSIVNRTRAEIRDILTPAQQAEMDRQRAQRDSAREALFQRCQEQRQQNGDRQPRPQGRREPPDPELPAVAEFSLT
jgi:Spy/CpxP family protein refolding chaperone